MYQKFSLISATAVDNFYNHSVYRTVLDLKNPIKGYNLLKSHFNFNVFILKQQESKVTLLRSEEFF